MALLTHAYIAHHSNCALLIIVSHHLEFKLKAGSYAEDNEVSKYGMEKSSNGHDIVLYHTDKGIAVDLKQYNQHIILSTINNGDVLSAETWEFIKDTVLEELEVPNTGVHQHDDAIKAHGTPYAQQLFPTFVN